MGRKDEVKLVLGEGAIESGGQSSEERRPLGRVWTKGGGGSDGAEGKVGRARWGGGWHEWNEGRECSDTGRLGGARGDEGMVDTREGGGGTKKRREGKNGSEGCLKRAG